MQNDHFLLQNYPSWKSVCYGVSLRLQVFSSDVTAALQCVVGRLQVSIHEYRRVLSDVTAALQCVVVRLQMFPHEYW